MTRMQINLNQEQDIKLSTLKYKWKADKKDIVNWLINNIDINAKRGVNFLGCW